MINLPNELDAHRYRVSYRGDDSVYILVSTYNDEPVEVFASFDSVADHESFFMHSAWNALTRLTSISLQCIGLIDTITQLERSSIDKRDAPGRLLFVLKKYIKENA